jgi:hypothetical protein
MRKQNSLAILRVWVLSVIIGSALPLAAFAATAPDLGLATSYSVFGKAGVTNTVPATHVWGNLGADLLASITGLLAGQVGGSINAGVGVAGVETAIQAAYDYLDNAGVQGAPTATSLSGPAVTITPGTYTVSAPDTLDGTVTLDGPGVYIFRSDSAFTVASGAKVLLVNGATACNVFWQIPSSMTIGTNAEMVGTIIANTALISMDTGATLQGRVLSRIAQVTLDNNQITEPVCPLPVITPPPSSGGSSSGRTGNNWSEPATPIAPIVIVAVATTTGQVLGITTYAPGLPATGYPPLGSNVFDYLGVVVVAALVVAVARRLRAGTVVSSSSIDLNP